ncbi:MAG: hypothetical protein C0467_29350 [Planctomycetaceae bacterium]|nr:hypothetical protein [Planctomycetaceae bacterium]
MGITMRPTQLAIWVTAMMIGVLAQSAASVAAAEPQHCYVLAIGIDKYKDTSFRPLQGAVKDAEAVAELYRGEGPGVTVKTLLDEAATAAAIGKALSDIETKAKPGDRVVVYLSSHGARVGERFRFIPHDDLSEAADGRSKEALHYVNMNMTHFAMSLERLTQGREVMLIIDACHAGQALTNVASTLNRKLDGGLVLLASSAAGQYSIDGPDNGRFTAALLEALRGRADADGNGAVTLKELRRYLSIRMMALKADLPRLPGMPLAEQDFVCDASYSIPESMTLARPKGKAPTVEPITWIPAHPSKLDSTTRVAPGTWRWVYPFKNEAGDAILNKDGKPQQLTYVLDLSPNGTYIAEERAGDSMKITAGKWKQSLGSRSDIDLVFGGGVDTFRAEAVTADSLRATVYTHGWSTSRNVGDLPFVKFELVYDRRRPPTTFTFERVKEKK